LARPLRVHLPGGFYHVTLRGNHQQDIFRDSCDRDLLNAIVERALERHAAQVHAYCWMSNHLHILARVATIPLGHVMRDIASNYARAYQLKVPTTGHLFERRYHATLIDADSYLLEVVRYIHLNPVVAGIVNHVSRYPWSSHAAYAGGPRPSWVTTDFALAMFGSSRSKAQAAYCRFVDAVPDATLAEPQRGAAGILGSETFIASIPAPSIRPKVSLSLGELAAQACVRFDVSDALLVSAARTPQVIKARAWIARRATEQGIATLSGVARFLGRDRATLRHAMRHYDDGPDSQNA
jgi:REP element-mobilizing transposase RayT